MDLKVKAALSKLFRAFNRKPSEDAIMNFMEFVDGYPFMVIKAAIQQEISEAEKMPTPAKLLSNCKAHSPRTHFICEDCNGNGFLFSEPRHDDYGFIYIKSDHAIKCACITSLAPNHPPIISGNERKLYSLALMFARSVALKSREHSDNLTQWKDRFWGVDTRPRWIKGAKLIHGLNQMCEIADLIKTADPKQCYETPFKLAASILEKYNGKTIRGQREKMGKASFQFNI